MANKHSRYRSSRTSIDKLAGLLAQIDPDCHYGAWLSVLMALFYETGGSEEGFELADEWSSGGEKYAGDRAIRTKWNSFKLGHEKPVTIGTLIWMAKRG